MRRSVTRPVATAALLRWTEALRKTNPQTGASIGRGTTALARPPTTPLSGTVLSINVAFRRFSPTVAGATDLDLFSDSLRQTDQRASGPPGRSCQAKADGRSTATVDCMRIKWDRAADA